MINQASSLLNHLNAVQAALESASIGRNGVLSDGAFLNSDPILSRLNKQKLDAQKYHQRLVRDFGQDDAMSEAAQEQLQNAKEAYEARLLQLRSARDSSEVIQEIKQKRAIERELEQQKAALKADNDNYQKAQEAKRRKRKENFWFLMMVYLVWQSGKKMQNHLQMASPLKPSLSSA